MDLYPPFIPKEANLTDNEYAYIINDVRDMYIDALEKEQLHRYTLIGLYYYRYVDEYNRVIDGIFERNMWRFPVIKHCNICNTIIIPRDCRPKRAASQWESLLNCNELYGRCPRCHRRHFMEFLNSFYNNSCAAPSVAPASGWR